MILNARIRCIFTAYFPFISSKINSIILIDRHSVTIFLINFLTIRSLTRIFCWRIHSLTLPIPSPTYTWWTAFQAIDDITHSYSWFQQISILLYLVYARIRLFPWAISSGCNCTSLNFISGLSVSLLFIEHAYSSYVIFLSPSHIFHSTVGYRRSGRIVLISTSGCCAIFSLFSIIRFPIFYSPSQCSEMASAIDLLLSDLRTLIASSMIR